jgi:HSP20 family protein
MLATVKNGNYFPSLLDELLNTSAGQRVIIPKARYASPAVNIIETPDLFRIEVAAPGFAKENFKLSVDKRLLTIASTREDRNEIENERIIRREFSPGAFERTFSLPESADTEKISAAYHDGVLEISIGKKDTAIEKPAREINVE